MKTIIIFSGFNMRAVYSFLRTLEKNHIDYAIIASSKRDAIFKTKYRENVLSVRSKLELNLNDIFNSLAEVQSKKVADQYLIAPSTEALNRFLIKYRSKFNKEKCEIPLVGKKLYEKISDKYSFSKACKDSNILVPKEYKNMEVVKLPCVAKPKEYFSKSGNALSPILIFNKEDQKKFLNKFNKDDFFYQEFVGGESYYLLYYFSRDGDIYKFSQINYIQQPDGKSILAASSSDCHQTNESLKYENLLKSLNFFGLIMIEIKYYKGRYYMIEANPRFWGPSQLFVDAGVNLFEFFAYDFNCIEKLPIIKEKKTETRYFWFGGIMQIILKKKKCIFHNYALNDYVKEFSKWISVDIYRRSDTCEIFKEEIGLI